MASPKHCDPRSGEVGTSMIDIEKNSVNGDLPSSEMDPGKTVITFRDIVYTVETKKCKSAPKEIIKGISGYFPPGINAIMGATGSGKTSLLDIIAARKNPSGLQGVIKVNGEKQPSNWKCMTGYVVQDDVVMGTLTVRENFMFSANLRLPTSVSRAEKEARVEHIINELGLPHVADSKVGTEFIRGISGGERKRTNIGMELIISPKVLFLDEPTTGLDASTANAVILLLHRLAKKGKTIIFSIHQPRYSIFKLFDNLALLSRGHMVYHGPAQEALEYFAQIGHHCEEHNNPADFFLDVVNGDSTAVQMAALAKGDDQQFMNSITFNVEPDSEDKLSTELSEQYKSSQWHKSILANVERWSNGNSMNDELHSDVALPAGQYATSFLTQFMVLSKRAVLNIVRNPQTSIMQVFVMVIFAVLVGIIYYRMDLSTAGLQNRVGALFFIVMNQIFGNLSAVELFIKERKVFIHENANGFYRVSSYFLAKLFCDVIPMRFIPNTGFAIVVYFMTGLQQDAAKFFLFLLMISLTSLAASSLGFFFSATVSVFALANLCIALCYVFMMVFSGLLVQLDSVLVWLRWIKWVSIFRYGLNGLAVNELKELTFCDYRNISGIVIPTCINGTEQMRTMSIPYETTWDLWQNVVALASMAAIFLVFTYIQLRRVNKYS